MARWKLIVAVGLTAGMSLPGVAAQATESAAPEVAAPEPAAAVTADDWTVTLICPSGKTDCTPAWGKDAGGNTQAQYRLLIDNLTSSRIYLCGRVKMFINKDLKGTVKFEGLKVPSSASDYILPNTGYETQLANPYTSYKSSDQRILRKNDWTQGPNCHA